MFLMSEAPLYVNVWRWLTFSAGREEERRVAGTADLTGDFTFSLPLSTFSLSLSLRSKPASIGARLGLGSKV